MTDRINEIRARCEAATPGPWSQGRIYEIMQGLNSLGTLKSRSNANFVAESREDISWLLAEVERLKETNKTLHREALSIDSSAAEAQKEYRAKIKRLLESQRWIPVSERLPTEKDADRLGFILAYSSDMKQSTVCVWHYILDDMVTSHWMPLPEPPKDATNE